METATQSAPASGARLGFEDPRLPARFWRSVSPEPNTGCWLWHGATTAQGYGNWWVGGTMRLTHRQVLEAVGTTIPKSLNVDHLCRQRACCNPDHLELVTPRVNVQRAKDLVRACPAGHEYTPENTYVRKGWRFCRECNRQRARATAAWKRSAA